MPALMIVAIYALLLLYSYVLSVLLACVRRQRSGPRVRPGRVPGASATPSVPRLEGSLCPPDDQERLWTALDEVQLTRLLRDASR
jgi:hypothetical protein